MYNQSATGAETGSNLNPSELIRQMREDGLAMKKGAVGLLELPNGPSNSGSHQLIASSSEDEDHMNETELKFLEGLSTKKKLKLLKYVCFRNNLSYFDSAVLYHQVHNFVIFFLSGN